MITKLCQSTIDPDSYGTSLTVTGFGGFGKTSIVTALCHHPVIKEQFKDGVVFIELGPHAIDPSMKLSQLYHLLTGELLKQGDINHAEQEIKQVSSLCCNLLVIIDDVWHVEDAEPIVKAFSHCKIVLTTRMNDIEQYIPTKQVVSVGPMEQSEAILLLTSGVIDISQLSREGVNLLDELAQDVHLWPLLLSLVKGQLLHHIKYLKSTYLEAIKCMKGKLFDKGLVAFDKNNITRTHRFAVKACIDVTLESLTKASSAKMKSLIIWNGIGNTMQIGVLHTIWNTTENEALDIVHLLWSYGLLQYTRITIPPHKTQICVEVHAVISHYIIESIDSFEAYDLSPFNTLGDGEAINEGLVNQIERCYGAQDEVPQSHADFLKYKMSEIQNLSLPFYLKWINMWTTLDPHIMIVILQRIQNALRASQMVANIQTFFDKISRLSKKCRKALEVAYKISRKLNRTLQRCLVNNDFKQLIQTIQTYVRNYPAGCVAQQVASFVDSLNRKANIELPIDTSTLLEYLYLFTPKYHHIGLLVVPRIKLYLKQLQRIQASLLSGPQKIELAYTYFMSNECDEDSDSVQMNYFFAIQEVAPGWVSRRIEYLNQL